MAQKARVKPGRKNKKPANHHRLYRLLLVVLAVFMGAVLSTTAFWRWSLATPSLPAPPLKDLAAKHGVDLGIHVLLDRLDTKPYADIVTSQHKSLVIDGEAHWKTLRPSATTYNFREVDAMVDYAEAHKMPVEAHHLLWGEHNWLPAWLTDGTYTKQQLLELIKDHITTVVGRYKGRIDAWTVVNETFTRAKRNYNLRDWWAERLGGGTDYIDLAFQWAHAADPNAKLILNDFDNQIENRYSNLQYDYTQSAVKRGIPIHGLGLQLHVSAAYPPDKARVIKNIRRFADIGVKTYVTEFDVNVNYVKRVDDAEKRRREADVTYQMVRACVESKACVRFTPFGISDKNDTLKRLMKTDSHSFFYDSRFRPKPSFYKFRQAWQEP
jgi:endo-1,4-beta-xylanase